MIIDIGRLAKDGETFEGEVPEAALELGAGPVEPGGPLRYRLRAQVFFQELLVRGTLRMPVRLRCSRCDAPFAGEVAEPRFEAVREVAAGVEYVDLTPEIRESIILAFPSYPVCSSECRGLCPQCGANLNEASCSCAAQTGPRWGGLDKLKIGSTKA